MKNSKFQIMSKNFHNTISLHDIIFVQVAQHDKYSGNTHIDADLF